MSALRRLWLRLRFQLDPARFERELADEIRFHLESRTRDNLHAGMSADEARSDALRRFGNRTLAQERSRDAVALGWLDVLRQDLRYARRSLRKSPAFTTVAVLSLALGIGATTAIFTLINVMLLKPLPFAGADRLVLAYRAVTPGIFSPSDTVPWGYVHYLQFRRSVPAFEDVGFFTWEHVRLSGGDHGAERLKIEIASASYFSTLGMSAARGRLFLPAEDVEGSVPPVALISHRLWQRRFAGDPGAVGAGITLDGAAFTIVGVLPPSFTGLHDGTDAWIPIESVALLSREQGEMLRTPMGRMGQVVARLRAGVAHGVVQAQLAATWRELHVQYPERMPRLEKSTWGVGTMPLAESRRHPLVRPLLTLLGGAVVVTLLVVCANLASLLLARSSARQGEMAVRIALGAGRLRIARQVLVECLVLAALGGSLGIVVGYWGASALATLRPELPAAWQLLRRTDLLESARLVPDWRVVAFAIALTLATTVLFAVAPALASARTRAGELLKSGAGRGNSARVRGRSALVVSEVALATALLVGAILMMRSFRNVLAIDPGFDARNVATMRVSGWDTTGAASAQRAELVQRLASMPGVETAALQSCPELSSTCIMAPVMAVDGQRVVPREYPPIEIHVISPEYVTALRIPLHSGRGFDGREAPGGPASILVNASAARLFERNGSPLGRRVATGMTDSTGAEIVGVVGDVKYLGLAEPAPPVIYVPHTQWQAPVSDMGIYVRTRGDAAAALLAIRRLIAESNPRLAIFEPQTLESIVRRASSSTRFITTLLVAFGVAAVFLASLGVYGVLAYSVSQRTREFGVRMALGAQRHDVLGVVARHGAALTAVGVVAGCGAALLVSGVMRRFLYGVAHQDGATFVVVVPLVLTVGLLAAYVPARRATAVDPLVALRGE